MSKPRLLVLDEPSTGLAPLLARAAYEALGVLRERGLTVLVTEQQVRWQWLSVIAVTFSKMGSFDSKGRLNNWQQIRCPQRLSGSDMIANILDGIVLGLQFGLLAIGLTLIYGLGGVLNLAYGQITVTSAMTVAIAMDAGIPILPAVGLGLLAGGLLGLIARSIDPAPGLPSARRGTCPAQPAAHPGRIFHH